MCAFQTGHEACGCSSTGQAVDAISSMGEYGHPTLGVKVELGLNVIHTLPLGRTEYITRTDGVWMSLARLAKARAINYTALRNMFQSYPLSVVKTENPQVSPNLFPVPTVPFYPCRKETVVAAVAL